MERLAQEEKRKAAGRSGPEEEDEVREQAERERQRREDEEREARKAAEKAEAEAAAKERARQKAAQKAERKRQAEEEEKRLAEERKAFSPEDFAALQELRAEVSPREEQESADEDEDDDEALLEKEIQRVKKEEADRLKNQSKPKTMAELMMQIDGMPVMDEAFGAQAKKAMQARQRSALKEKLQARREMNHLGRLV